MCLGPCFWYRFCPNHPDKNRGNHHTIVMYDLSITISRSARFPRRSRNFMILKFGNNSGKIIMYDVFYSTKNNLVSANHRRVGREFSGFLRNIFTNHNTYIRHFSLRVRLEYFFWKIMLIFSRNMLLINSITCYNTLAMAAANRRYVVQDWKQYPSYGIEGFTGDRKPNQCQVAVRTLQISGLGYNSITWAQTWPWAFTQICVKARPFNLDRQKLRSKKTFF